MTLIKRMCLGLWAAGTLFTGTALADDPKRDYQPFISKTVDAHILPASEQFAGLMQDLQGRATAYCQSPTESGFSALKASFTAGLQGWQALQFVTFGPVERGNRGQKVYFWPDKKNAGDRQMGMLLRDNKVDLIKNGQLGKASVAIQGLPALETLLYSPKHAEALAKGGDEGKARCDFIIAIADNLVDLSHQLKNDWIGPKGWAVQMKNAGAKGNHYTDPRQAASQIYNALYTQIQAVAEVKLAHALGDTQQSARIFRFESYKSRQSLQNIITNLIAIRDVTTKAGWVDAAGEGGQDFLASLDYAIAAAQRLDGPLEHLIETDKGWAMASMLKDSVKAVAVAMDTNIGPVLDLQVGFNALDGD